MSAPLPLSLRVHHAITDVAEAAWDALLDEAGLPFLEWAFLAALEETGCVSAAAGWHPRHLTLWRGARLVAAAPAYLKDDSHGEFVFDFSWATAAERVGVRYYPKLVLAVPFTPATGRRVLVAPGEDRAAREAELYAAALEYARASGLSGVHVHFPTADEASRLEGCGFALRLGVQYHWLNAGYGGMEDFLARFHAKRRHQLRRELKGPEAQGLTVRTLRGDALSSVDPEALYQLYAATVDRYGWSPRALNAPFFRRMLERFGHRVEWVEARRRTDGKLVAGAFNLAAPRVLYGRYWGTSQAPETHPFLHFNVCLYEPVRACIERGLERFEPGAGGEHKLTRGFEPQLTYSAHRLFHAGLDRAVRAFLLHEQAAVRQGLPFWRAETGFKQAALPEPR
ncbi:N-acetyltransferase [Aggregicoccus sp. 17bor-14]|uniref:GNAT family N-acetyltransferase n=1 Tax=Myxococcaceae TaxID=31 RepID=UPI00129C888A|nr:MULTISPECIES: GNAT family N-acetyltransferase [Myxococcaceae]MBF5042131.1 N-acetyltransferase [Simulacricoccus sp. 17bor-14]MRI87908.1 N-acetyltransferase [Aggregicoccus sp. 17bor-14]